MSAPITPREPGRGAQRPTPPPASGHHDAQWYRRVATKASADPETLPPGRISDDAAWAAVSLMTAGILLYGGVGWLLGRWLGNQSLLVALGVLVGVALAIFMLFRRLEPSRPEARDGAAGPGTTGHRAEDVAPMPAQTDPSTESHRVR